MVDLRRDFSLPDDDVEYLNGLGLKWELIQDGGIRALILYGFLMPNPFQPKQLSLKIKLPQDYTSGAALDMFFTDEHVSRADGLSIQRLTESSVFDQKKWWQWSRHYPSKTRWRPGINTLSTHLSYVKNILIDEASGKSWT